MIYSHSNTSVLSFTLTKSSKGKPTADVIAIGSHAVRKLGSPLGQQFARMWKEIEGDKTRRIIHRLNDYKKLYSLKFIDLSDNENESQEFHIEGIII